jgi:hypothetical protein
MNAAEKEEILNKFKIWFKDGLIESHKANTIRLTSLDEFNINPFLLHYLSNFLEGNSDPKSLAKVLIYPRVLGTSVTTSFGTQMQTFLTKVLDAYGSTTQGIDIEFIDANGKRKYCQLKSGPNALNRDDVTTIKGHFDGVRRLARTNNKDVGINDMLFCLLYGEPHEKNAFVKELERDYPVLIGKEFWHTFTGDEGFYQDLIDAVAEIAKEVDMKSLVEEVIDKLAEEIKTKLK